MKDFAFLNAAKATSELDSGCGVPLGPVVRLLFTTWYHSWSYFEHDITCDSSNRNKIHKNFIDTTIKNIELWNRKLLFVWDVTNFIHNKRIILCWSYLLYDLIADLLDINSSWMVFWSVGGILRCLSLYVLWIRSTNKLSWLLSGISSFHSMPSSYDHVMAFLACYKV